MVINEWFLALQRTQLYSGLSATRDAYSELLELKHNVALAEAIEMFATQQNIALPVASKSHEYKLTCFLNATHILHDVQLERNSKCKDISTSRVTSCEGQRKDVIRSSLNFGFEGATHTPSK